jgi:Asp-tRNA(Asn)/Glu-tRNA(Gln) amidotransferase B subunit
VPLEPDRELVERLREGLPEAPWARIRRLEEEVGFALAEGLVTSGRDDLFARTTGDRRAVANVLMNEFAGFDGDAADPVALAKAIAHRGDVSPDTFRDALAASVSDPASIDVVLSNRAVSDLDELDPVIDRILGEHEGQVAAYRGGKEGLLGFFVGQVMKETGGKASPQVVNERLREKLKA